MATFVHIAPESKLSRIRRNGIGRSRRRVRPGVFAVPVTRNFYLSHQWLRELRRLSRSDLLGIYFRIPDDEEVWIGHYNSEPRKMSAAEAVGVFDGAENREGWQVVVSRRITPSEIIRIKTLPRIVGWRFFPGARGKGPFCGCEYCTRGEYGSRKLRARLNAGKLRLVKSTEGINDF